MEEDFMDIMNRISELQTEYDIEIMEDEVDTILQIAFPNCETYYNDCMEDLFQGLCDDINSGKHITRSEYYYLEYLDLYFMLYEIKKGD